LASRHRGERVGSVGLEAFALSAALDGTSGALCCQLEAVDERHSGLWWESTGKTDHAEGVAPVAEVPCAQLSAMELVDICAGLAVLAGLVTELSEARAPCHLEQFGLGTRRLGLCPDDLGRLAQGQFTVQEGQAGTGAIGQAGRGLQGLAGLASRSAHLAGNPCSPIVEAQLFVGAAGNSTS